MQVLQSFSREIVIRCPACRFRPKDIHEMSPIVWVWYRLRDSFCLWSHPSFVRTPRTEIGGLLFAGMHHDRISLRALHEWSGPGKWSSINDSIFLRYAAENKLKREVECTFHAFNRRRINSHKTSYNCCGMHMNDFKISWVAWLGSLTKPSKVERPALRPPR